MRSLTCSRGTGAARWTLGMHVNRLVDWQERIQAHPVRRAARVQADDPELFRLREPSLSLGALTLLGGHDP